MQAAEFRANLEACIEYDPSYSYTHFNAIEY